MGIHSNQTVSNHTAVFRLGCNCRRSGGFCGYNTVFVNNCDTYVRRCPNEVVHTLIDLYRANKPEDSDWVVLPVASFDAYFGSTNFSPKWLVKIPDTILTREKQSFGVCRYKENI